MSKTSYSSNAFKKLNLNFATDEDGTCFIADSEPRDQPDPNTDRLQNPLTKKPKAEGKSGEYVLLGLGLFQMPNNFVMHSQEESL